MKWILVLEVNDGFMEATKGIDYKVISIKKGSGKVGAMKKLYGGKIRADENGEAEIITDEFEGMDSFQKDQHIADVQGLL